MFHFPVDSIKCVALFDLSARMQLLAVTLTSVKFRFIASHFSLKARVLASCLVICILLH